MKTARTLSAPTESMLLSQNITTLWGETLEAVGTLLRAVLMGALLLAVLRVTFETIGSQSSSVAATVMTLSQWLVVPFQHMPGVTGSLAAVVTLLLINGIVASFPSQKFKEAS